MVEEQERRRRRAEIVEEEGAGEEGDVDGVTGQNPLEMEGPGFLSRVFRRVFKIVDRPWKMLPLGILFGLGFDTSSEIALLGIASVQGAKGTSMWVILIFPALFTGKFSRFLCPSSFNYLVTC